jgi:hypothetical protein
MRHLYLFGLALAAGFPVNAEARSDYDLTTPREQIEQRCDVEAMSRLDADKVIAYTFAEPTYGPHHIDAPGAVFRRNEQWYRLEYHCSVHAKHGAVTAFDMKVGSRIAKRDWDKYYLYP